MSDIFTITDKLNSIGVNHNLNVLIRKQCIYCHYELYVNDKLTHLMCINPQCPGHMAAKMEAMFKLFKVKNMGRANCLSLAIENNLLHHMEVFTLGIDDMPSRYGLRVRTELYKDIQSKRTQTLSNIVRACKLQGLNKRAIDVFTGYSDIDKFYQDFKGSKQFIANKLGIKEGKTVNEITESIMRYEALFRVVVKFFNIEKEVSSKLNIAMTGSVKSATKEAGTKYKSREEYFLYIKNKYKDIVNIINLDRVTDSCQVLLCDAKSSSSKYTSAIKKSIPIISFKDIDNIDTINSLANIL